MLTLEGRRAYGWEHNPRGAVVTWGVDLPD